MNQIRISDYIIAIIELFEAEARAAKRSILGLFFSLCLIGIAALLFLAALVFLFYGIYLLLLSWVSALMALFILAAILLSSAVLMVALAMRRQ